MGVGKPGHPDHPPIQVLGFPRCDTKRPWPHRALPHYGPLQPLRCWLHGPLGQWNWRRSSLWQWNDRFFLLFSVVLCLFLGCVLFRFGLFCLVWSCCFWFVLIWVCFVFSLGLFCFASCFGWYCVCVCFVLLLVLCSFAWLFVCWLTGLFVGNCGVISTIGSREECCFMMAWFGTKSWR